MKVVKTACELCAWSCGMEAYVEGGKVVRVKGMKEHPLNNGRLCPKGSVTHEYVYAKDRITTPMLNEDGRKLIGILRLRFSLRI